MARPASGRAAAAWSPTARVGSSWPPATASRRLPGRGTHHRANSPSRSCGSVSTRTDHSPRTDFFSPFNNTNLDRDDADLGSGGPLAIPDGYGTAAHPHLLVEIGKDGRLFLLDRDNLGGTSSGDVRALQIGGPYNGLWGHPAFWGGDTGYVYVIGNGGPLLAFQVGVSGTGRPALTAVGQSTSTWGYTSGSPVVTSDGTTPGSALVWAVYSSGSGRVGRAVARVRSHAQRQRHPAADVLRTHRSRREVRRARHGRRPGVRRQSRRQ